MMTATADSAAFDALGRYLTCPPRAGRHSAPEPDGPGTDPLLPVAPTTDPLLPAHPPTDPLIPVTPITQPLPKAARCGPRPPATEPMPAVRPPVR